MTAPAILAYRTSYLHNQQIHLNQIFSKYFFRKKYRIHKSDLSSLNLNFDFWRKCRFSTKNFDFWPKLRFLRKLRFLNKISIFDQNFNFSKTSIFDQNFDFWHQFWFLTKISIVEQNFNFWPKFQFVTKISTLTNISIADQTLDFWANFGDRYSIRYFFV